MISGSVVIAFIAGSIAIGSAIAGIRILLGGGLEDAEVVPVRPHGRPELRICN
ncbi:hypothetical protein [Methylorubrum extorquens]|jgi:hypothetical protein|uniref:Uncharacterized protein n=1 Tax=Methylorubrum extorquens (strain ATCC 14718 / DSM 1338 / JCM 2805 / NCIMB 9133 / AM1) TaxID=272630 RepID=C5B4U4_METEA|nr:hypothetical protein [Methylorubrum extorquens]ACS43476.1 Hypothetical protein MexAM1_META2p0630 [Methylorubrum extorquens AM1]MCP1545434.1 hypothetical protein [Methylorubrum extorquens]MCP1591385.1 hypothetical protein [Methylorubrum extorquens]